jgi:hypothetical protein
MKPCFPTTDTVQRIDHIYFVALVTRSMRHATRRRRQSEPVHHQRLQESGTTLAHARGSCEFFYLLRTSTSPFWLLGLCVDTTAHGLPWPCMILPSLGPACFFFDIMGLHVRHIPDAKIFLIFVALRWRTLGACQT